MIVIADNVTVCVIVDREPSDFLIIISRTEGLMCGINRRCMGDYGMAGLKLPPKLCV